MCDRFAIFTENDAGYPWFREGGVRAKGYLFDADDRCHHGAALPAYFRGCSSVESFEKRLQEANGFFAVIIEHAGTLLAAVNRLRSIPLSYSGDGARVVIADRAERVARHLGADSLDESACFLVLCFGFVPGDGTLVKGVRQLTAGNLLAHGPEGTLVRPYYRYTYDLRSSVSRKQLLRELDEVHTRVAHRLVDLLQDRLAVIPLSGGQD